MTPPGLPQSNPFEDPPEPPAPRRRGLPRWLGQSVLPAVIGGVVVLGGVAATGNLGGGGGDTTVVRPVAELPSAAVTPEPAPAPEPATDDGTAAAKSVQRIVMDAAPSVVKVTAGEEGGQRLGSGFVIDRHGRILTNQHVLGGSDTAEVTFDDGSVRDAEVLGSDRSTDIAVLDVDDLPPRARPIPLGRSAGLQVGEEVVAIGNPFGLERTATTGIVSALKRTIDAPNGFPIQNVVQTDAAINQGNSGGPLLDGDGKVIGINSQIATNDGGNDGVGFAVPSDTIRPIVESIIESGEAEHAWIGITGVALTPDTAEEIGAAGRRGVAVVQLDDRGPAKKAGVKASGDPDALKGADLIVEVGGSAVTDMADVSQAVASRRVGEEVALTVVRGGDTVELALVLADRPGDVGVRG